MGSFGLYKMLFTGLVTKGPEIQYNSGYIYFRSLQADRETRKASPTWLVTIRIVMHGLRATPRAFGVEAQFAFPVSLFNSCQG